MTVLVPVEQTGDNSVRSARNLPIIGALAVVFLAFSGSWVRYPAVWSEERTHGFVIAGLCMWLIWRDRARLEAQGHAQPLAIAALLALSLVWMAAMAISAQVVHLALAPMVLVAWLLAVKGTGAARAGLEISVVFSLAIPVWELLNRPLKVITVAVNRLLINLAHIHAEVSGTEIRLGSGTILVAESCAGLNYLMVGLSLGTVYAFLFHDSWRPRVKLLLATGAVAMLANWVRVFGLVVIGEVTRMQSPLMKEHGLYGWVIFSVSLTLFISIAARIERRAMAVEKVGGGPQSSASIAAPACHEAAPRPFLVATATFAALAGPLIYLGLSSTQPRHSVANRLPGVAASSTAIVLSPSAARWTPSFSGAVEHRLREWKVNGVSVQADHYLYSVQRQDAEMIGGGNVLVADSLLVGERLVGPLDADLRMVREAMVRNGNQFRLVWYWYRADGIQTPSAARAKLLEFWSFLTRGEPSELVALSAACDATDCSHARAAIYRVVLGHDMPAALPMIDRGISASSASTGPSLTVVRVSHRDNHMSDPHDPAWRLTAFVVLRAVCAKGNCIDLPIRLLPSLNPFV